MSNWIEVDTVSKATLLEDAALSASPIACAVADAFTKLRQEFFRTGTGAPMYMSEAELYSFAALEAATRESPLRKVKA